MNCGISLYCKKYFSHPVALKGGKIPPNNSHFVIDRPDSVNLVKPPTKINNATNVIKEPSQVKKKYDIFYFSTYKNLIYDLYNNLMCFKCRYEKYKYLKN